MTESRKADLPQPLIIPRPDHPISRANISKNALKVLYRLKDAGYQAFLVGGGVRDLLLGLSPKDFDIATDARPEEVRALFSNCRLIGRRFRLAHVRFSREIIEVATFRGTGNTEITGSREEDHVVHQSGRIIADNAWGSIEEDAMRRDFTANALYYNIADYSIWDFTGGVDDVDARTLRLIGDAERRYREDPVRMLRAARLSAKLELDVHPSAAEPIPQMASLIDDVPPARLFDEFLKLFQTGHALASYQALRRLGLFEHLFPATFAEFADGNHCCEALVEAALKNTDKRVREDRPITPMFLFAVFLWHPAVSRARRIAEREDCSDRHALQLAVAEISSEQTQRIAMPRRYSLPMREVLQLQPRLQKTGARGRARLVEHKRFRAAYDLLVLRAAIGEVDGGTVDYWDEAQSESPQRHDDRGNRGRKRRRRRRSSRQPGAAPAN